MCVISLGKSDSAEIEVRQYPTRVSMMRVIIFFGIYFEISFFFCD